MNLLSDKRAILCLGYIMKFVWSEGTPSTGIMNGLHESIVRGIYIAWYCTNILTLVPIVHPYV